MPPESLVEENGLLLGCSIPINISHVGRVEEYRVHPRRGDPVNLLPYFGRISLQHEWKQLCWHSERGERCCIVSSLVQGEIPDVGRVPESDGTGNNPAGGCGVPPICVDRAPHGGSAPPIHRSSQRSDLHDELRHRRLPAELVRRVRQRSPLQRLLLLLLHAGTDHVHAVPRSVSWKAHLRSDGAAGGDFCEWVCSCWHVQWLRLPPSL